MYAFKAKKQIPNI